MADVKGITDEQLVEALIATAGNYSEAARRLNLNESSVRRRAPKLGFGHNSDGGVYPVLPRGHKVWGVSSLVETVDENTGNTRQQWVKTKEDPKLVSTNDIVQDVLSAMQDKIPKASPVARKTKKALPEHLCNLYMLTDYHLGMLAWSEETGDDWDMKIAESMMEDWFSYAIAHSPDASQAVLCQLGDFLHYDSMRPETPTSGHILDSDTRPQKMIRVAIRTLRNAIKNLLYYHDSVHVLMAEGNHDLIGSAWLREVFAVLYEDEPRVTVEIRPDPYYCYVWGDTVLFFHHGHLRKMQADLDSVFASKFRREYGNSRYAYGHTGHLHHQKVLEKNLMPIEQHPTLAGADAHSSRGGWMSDRIAKVMTYHKEFGEVGRIGVTPEMLKA